MVKPFTKKLRKITNKAFGFSVPLDLITNGNLQVGTTYLIKISQLKNVTADEISADEEKVDLPEQPAGPAVVDKTTEG